jgi:SAM-dependent methyltransferase
METAVCSLCLADDFEVAFEGPDRLCPLSGLFRLVRCRGCGSYYQNPRPDSKELESYYLEDYLAFQAAIDTERSILKRIDRRYGIHKKCRLLLKERPAPGKLLDIGCATGLFLSSMKERGWDVLGIELNEKAAAYAREQLGLDVLTAAFENTSFEPHQFDAVTLWDVLEHLPDPVLTLEKISTILRPGGILIIHLPNPDSREAKTFGPYWVGWDLPRHLNLFTFNGLSGLLKRRGFRIHRLVSATGNYFGLKKSLEWLLEDESSPRSKGQRLLRVLDLLGVLRPSVIPIYPLLNPLRWGSYLTVVAEYPADPSTEAPSC